MQLTSISYKEFEGQDQEWTLDGLTLGRINLLVGKNATGKSRTLNLIGGLAQLLCGDRSPTLLSGSYRATFVEGEKRMVYSLRIEDRQVLSESFTVDGVNLLKRGENGEGLIYADKINKGMMIEFQTPQDELAAFVRRDSKQHSFLEPLHAWGIGVRHYSFGTPLGKDHFPIVVKKGGAVPDGKKADEVVGLFMRAKKDFRERFVGAVVRDMESVDYPISEIGVAAPVSIQFEHSFSDDLVGLWVREHGLKGITDQAVMSQGMFRVLSILILTNYLECKQLPACLIIDDIGEGLDFDRSCLLIDLLRAKAAKSKIQLITATNDKFVMNQVPLDEWSVLNRKGSNVHVLNHENSRELFEEFRFTGLSNFSFFEMDYLNAQPEETAAHE